MLCRKNLFFLIATLFSSSIVGLNAYGQCGVHFRQKSTQFFPYSRVTLNRSEDVTGDGIEDLIASSAPPLSSSTRDRIFFIPNNGNGTFGAPIIINAPAEGMISQIFAVGDVNNDGLKDITALIHSSPAVIKSFINNGNGTFTISSGSSDNSGAPSELLDANADGFDDLRVSSGPGFSYRPGNGDGTFGATVEPIDLPNGFLIQGEFNADGKADFINNTTLYVNQGNATFTETNISSFFPTNTSVLLVRDFNGDGKSDVLTTDHRVLLRTDTSFSVGQTLSPDLFGVNPENYQWISGNFAGNSGLDLVYNDQFRNRKVVFTNDGAGNFTRVESADALVNPVQITYSFGDFDNDGKEDRIQVTSGTPNSKLVLPEITSFVVLKNVCDRPGQPRIVDFDRSGTSDLSFWNPATGEWAFLTSPDSFVRVESVNWGLGSLGDIPVPGDFDGDGITDRSVYRNDTGVWWIRKSSDLQWWGIPFGAPDDIPVPADYDGDTISDIAVFRPSDGHWYFWYMGTQTFAASHFGANGDKPAPADYDGDLKTDFAVFRPSNGVWYYYRSSDGTYVSVQWGLGTDRPMPADFDGDGKADITVFRDSDRVTYILRSYDLTARYFSWGAAGDIPGVLDYDGDFVADISQYRPSTEVWWLSSFSPTLLPPVFGDPGVIPTTSIIRVE